MALTIADKITFCTPGAVSTVLNANVGRKAGAVQNQSHLSDTPVTVRVGFGADPTATDGALLGPGEILSVGDGAPGSGNNVDFYEGDVRIFNPSASFVTFFGSDAE